MKKVHLELVQGDQRWSLGKSDADGAADDRLGRIRWEVTVPTDIHPGQFARLRASTAKLRVSVREQ